MLSETVHSFIKKDRYIAERNRNEITRSQQWIAIIAAVGFAIMSILNVEQGSWQMLASTAGAALFLLIGWLFSLWKKNTLLIRIVFYIILLIVFPIYVFRGGNEGFAALWLVILTYLTMYFLDFIIGFFINSFYFLMLIGLFIGPFTDVLPAGVYGDTFKLRYPFFYLINFAFSVYFIVSIRNYQYESMMKTQEMEQLSVTDLNTCTYNRNAFIRYMQDFDPKGVSSLSLVYIDANGLHELNNAQGHEAGDRMLKCIAAECIAAFPKGTVYRLGGDEFLVVCINCPASDIHSQLAHVVDALEQKDYSISYGIETCEGPVFDLEAICNRANKSMINFKAEYYKKTANDRRRSRV